MKGNKKPSPIQAAKKERKALNNELIEARETNRGKGLFAKVSFSTGEVVCGLTGDEEVIQPADKAALLQQRPETNDYAAEGPNGTSLVPRDLAAVGWHLANHSCNPNAILRTEYGIGLRAVRPIAEGNEITCWYGWSAHQVVCLCGEANCTGWIGVPLRMGPRGPANHTDDLFATVKSAWGVKNLEGIKTALKALMRAGFSNNQLHAFMHDALGPDAPRAIKLTGGGD